MGAWKNGARTRASIEGSVGGCRLHRLPKPERSDPGPRPRPACRTANQDPSPLENSDLTSRFPGANVAPSSMPNLLLPLRTGPETESSSAPCPRLNPGTPVIPPAVSAGFAATRSSSSSPTFTPRGTYRSVCAGLCYLGRGFLLCCSYTPKHTVQGK